MLEINTIFSFKLNNCLQEISNNVPTPRKIKFLQIVFCRLFNTLLINNKPDYTFQVTL